MASRSSTAARRPRSRSSGTAPGTTAILAYNDLMAIGALRAIRGAGRGARDVSVVGFDDVALAAYVDPPLTTIGQRTETMGRWAVEQSARAIRGPGDAADEPAGATTIRLPVDLEVRSSSGAAPAT